LTQPIVTVLASARTRANVTAAQVNRALGGRRYRGAEWKKKHHKKKIDTMYPMEYYSMYD